jgi:hypothetical protein
MTTCQIASLTSLKASIYQIYQRLITVAAAAKEEVGEVIKQRVTEVEYSEADLRVQNRDDILPLPWYSAPFRVQG